MFFSLRTIVEKGSSFGDTAGSFCHLMCFSLYWWPEYRLIVIQLFSESKIDWSFFQFYLDLCWTAGDLDSIHLCILKKTTTIYGPDVRDAWDSEVLLHLHPYLIVQHHSSQQLVSFQYEGVAWVPRGLHEAEGHSRLYGDGQHQITNVVVLCNIYSLLCWTNCWQKTEKMLHQSDLNLHKWSQLRAWGTWLNIVDLPSP